MRVECYKAEQRCTILVVSHSRGRAPPAGLTVHSDYLHKWFCQSNYSLCSACSSVSSTLFIGVMLCVLSFQPVTSVGVLSVVLHCSKRFQKVVIQIFFFTSRRFASHPGGFVSSRWWPVVLIIVIWIWLKPQQNNKKNDIQVNWQIWRYLI